MKKMVTYLVSLGLMLSMMPASSVYADDAAPDTVAVAEESTEKNADREGSAVAVMNNLNVILSLTDGADSNLDDYTKVTDERFNTIDSVKKFISENCTDELEDEFLKKCEKSLIEKEDGLYKRNSGRSYSIFLTDNGVEIVNSAMDAFIAVTKKRDEMNDYGGVLFKAEGSKWKAKRIESGFFTVNNSESDLESAAYIMGSCLDTIFNMLSYSAPVDSTDKITIGGLTYGKAKEEYQPNGLKYLTELINENCTGELREDLIKQAEGRYVEKDGVLYADINARGALDICTDEGFSVSDVNRLSFTAVSKKNSDKDGYAKLFFADDDGKWKISNYSFYDSLDEANKTVNLKDIAGTWIYEVADGGYTADLCSKNNGIITIKEDGTFTYKSAENITYNGVVKSSIEKYDDGSEIPYVIFSTGDTSKDFGGYYAEDTDMIYCGNGGMAHIVHDKNYDEELNKLAVERIENYDFIDLIASGGLEFENKEAFKEGDIPFFKVTDKRFKSLADIKTFINENTTGKINKELIGYCDEKFREKEGVLYESLAGKGSVETDTTKGVIITDKTDKSFKATTVAKNGIPGSGYTRAIFTADGDTWKINGIEYDTYAFNRTFDNFKNCAVSRAASLVYFMDYIESGKSPQDKEIIKIDGVEYVKHFDQYYSIDELKEKIRTICTGQPRERLLSGIDDRFIEKDGILYKKAEPGQITPDFELSESVNILSISSDEFKASTVKKNQKDGYAIFDFIKEGDRFLLNSYEFNSFNEERLFGGYVDTQSGGLNLREEPNTTSAKLAEIPMGTQLDIYESGTTGWYKVMYKGQTGYVSAEFIKEIPDGDIPVTTTTAATTSSTATSKTETLKSGDITKDDIIDGRDASAILTYYAKTSTGQKGDFDDNQKKAADVNSDKIIDGRDATLVLSYYTYTSTGHSVSLDEYISSQTTSTVPTTTTTTTTAKK